MKTALVAPARWRRETAWEFIRIAVEGLGRYKLRTALSVLGIVLGVAAVIAMMSVSEGARREALAQVELLGLDNLILRNRVPTAARSGPGGLAVRDAEALLRLTPLAIQASPLVERYLPVSHGSARSTVRVLGVRPSYQSILRLRPARGRLLSAVDDRTAARVCVIGAPLARSLFGYRDPIGERVRIGETYYAVVGVLAGATDEAPAGALAWRDLGQAVIAPLPALDGRTLAMTPARPVDEIWVQIGDGTRAVEAGNAIAHALTRLHGGDTGFEVVIPRELLAQRYRTQRTFGVVVGSIAVLALLVGGIGIMNIMLTSVTERTKEIGVRRAVGATRRDVMLQFLMESLLMTLGGGLIGIVLGMLTSVAITAYAGWRTHISVQSVVLGFGVAASVGLFFGLYPAMKAARFEPVDALRHE